MMDYLAELDDAAARRFYEELENHRLMTTGCTRCGFLFFPPRTVCTECLGRGIEWVELSGRGKVYAFTQQHQGLAHTKPEVIGLIELEDARGRILSIIDAPFEEVTIGMAVKVSFFRSPFGYTMHRFERA